MTEQQDPRQNSNTQKPPEEWTTGDEAMTGAQRSYLKTLSDEAGVPFDDTLTKAQASLRIDELRRQTGRGLEREGASSGPGAAEREPRDGDLGDGDEGGSTGRVGHDPQRRAAGEDVDESQGGGSEPGDVRHAKGIAGPRREVDLDEALPPQPALAGEVAGTTDVAPDDPTRVREDVGNTSDSSGLKVDEEGRGDLLKRQLRDGMTEVSPMD